MGDVGRALGKGVGKVSKAIGLTGLIAPPKKIKADTPVLPDEEEIKRQARLRGARRARRGSRATTILDNQDTLG